jgi:dCMP deaminase
MRPSKDEYFMEIAGVVAKRSTCLRIHVGAVIVKDGQILSTGYNGAPHGFEHCLDIGCIREKQNIAHGTRHELCRAVHAEQNAIIQAAIHGVSIEGATLYCTHQPCILCTKMLINGKIQRVVFLNEYPDKTSLEFLKQAGIEITRMPGGKDELADIPEQQTEEDRQLSD